MRVGAALACREPQACGKRQVELFDRDRAGCIAIRAARRGGAAEVSGRDVRRAAAYHGGAAAEDGAGGPEPGARQAQPEDTVCGFGAGRVCVEDLRPTMLAGYNN